MAIKSYKLVSRVRQTRPGYSALGLIKKKKSFYIFIFCFEKKQNKKKKHKKTSVQVQEPRVIWDVHRDTCAFIFLYVFAASVVYSLPPTVCISCLYMSVCRISQNLVWMKGVMNERVIGIRCSNSKIVLINSPYQGSVDSTKTSGLQL